MAAMLPAQGPLEGKPQQTMLTSRFLHLEQQENEDILRWERVWIIVLGNGIQLGEPFI